MGKGGRGGEEGGEEGERNGGREGSPGMPKSRVGKPMLYAVFPSAPNFMITKLQKFTILRDCELGVSPYDRLWV